MVAQAPVWVGDLGARGSAPRRVWLQIAGCAAGALGAGGAAQKTARCAAGGSAGGGVVGRGSVLAGARARRRPRQGGAVPKRRRVAVAPVEPGARECWVLLARPQVRGADTVPMVRGVAEEAGAQRGRGWASHRYRTVEGVSLRGGARRLLIQVVDSGCPRG
ncbi:hypothetical protein Emag_007727 [Eimeria magna]